MIETFKDQDSHGLHFFVWATPFLTRGSVATEFRKNEAESCLKGSELLIFLKFPEGQMFPKKLGFFFRIFRMYYFGLASETKLEFHPGII